MTITVSVEELRAFEKAIVEWYQKRGVAYLKALEDQDHLRDYSTMSVLRSPGAFTAAQKSIAEWEKANPKPTLIPSI